MEDKKNENPLVAQFQALNPVSAEQTTQQIMENVKKNTIPENIKEIAAKLEQEAAYKAGQKLEKGAAAAEPQMLTQAGAMENMEENKVVKPVEKEIAKTVEITCQEDMDKMIAEAKQESQQSLADLPLEVPTSEDSLKVDEDAARVAKLAQDIRDYACQPAAIGMVMKALCEKVPQVVPNYTTWGCPDPIPFMHAKIQAPGYVEALISTLFILLNDSIWNVQWSAQVVIGITSTLVALDMPILIYDAHVRKEQEAHPIIVPEKPKLILP